MTKNKLGPLYVFGNAITSDTPQDIDHKSFRGFDKPDYDGKYLIAESVFAFEYQNLFAAAPDMLEALELAVEALNSPGGYCDNQSRRKISAAINKAKGEGRE